MLIHATFSTNPISIIIWLTLAFPSTKIFIAFATAVYFYYFRNKQDNQQNFYPIAPQIEHQLALETIHEAIRQYLERQHRPINMSILQ